MRALLIIAALSAHASREGVPHPVVAIGLALLTVGVLCLAWRDAVRADEQDDAREAARRRLAQKDHGPSAGDRQPRAREVSDRHSIGRTDTKITRQPKPE